MEPGDDLVVLESPALEKDIALTRKRIEVERLKSLRLFASQQELAKHQVRQETLKAHLTQLEGLLQQQQNLSLTAPIAGIVTDQAEALHTGRWINKELPLAYVIAPAAEELHAHPGHAGQRQTDPDTRAQNEEQREDQQAGDEEIVHVALIRYEAARPRPPAIVTVDAPVSLSVMVRLLPLSRLMPLMPESLAPTVGLKTYRKYERRQLLVELFSVEQIK